MYFMCIQKLLNKYTIAIRMGICTIAFSRDTAYVRRYYRNITIEVVE